MRGPRVELYVQAGCTDCDLAAAFLRARAVPFALWDVGRDAAARARMSGTLKSRAVPTLVIDGEVLVGFSRNRARVAELTSVGPTDAGAKSGANGT